MINSYKTVKMCAETEIVEKKSRFIANVSPIDSVDNAHNFIETIKKKYWDARHNVFAYTVQLENEILKMSDDGEPSKTAGMPVLDVIKGRELKNCIVVVTRYFGGTLLGAGGLVRAYSKAAKAGIEKAEIVTRQLYEKIFISVPYTLSGKVQYEILKLDSIINDTIYTDIVQYEVFAIHTNSEQLLKAIDEITGALAVCEKKELFYL